MDCEIVAFDLETHLFGPHNQAPKIVCLSYCSSFQCQSGIKTKPHIKSWLKKHFQDALDDRILLVGHYVAYDMACILANYPSLWDLVWQVYDKDKITCTLNREKLLDISQDGFFKNKGKYSLKDIVERRLGVIMNKGADSWRLRYAELENVPLEKWPETAKKYSLDDAIDTLKLFEYQQDRSESTGYLLPTQFEETRADFALKLMSAWGLETDQNKVEKLWNRTIVKMDELAKDIRVSGLASVMPKNRELFPTEIESSLYDVQKSMPAIRKAVEKYFDGPFVPRTDPTKRFPKGQIKTDKETLEQCNHKPLQQLVEFSALQKTSSTYIKKMFTPPIHARFDAIGAASDRTSCSNPNLQNQPRLPGVRECFYPRKGYVFLACDFDSQEMRTLAQSCLDILGHSKLAERYQADRYFDPHAEFAKNLADGNSNLDLDELRQHTKICNFGFPGGMVASTFCDYAKGWGLSISEKQAEFYRDAWFYQWPEMREYFRHIQSLVGDANYGSVTIPQNGFIRGGCKYTEASNTYFQTLAAHASKGALWAATKEAYVNKKSALYGSRPVFFVHDEIIFETPESKGALAATELEKVMIAAMERWTPDIPAAASATLMRYWSKKAKPVFKEGELVPWEG